MEDASIIKDIKDGKSISLKETDERVLICQKEADQLIALAVYERKEGDVYSPVRGLW